MNGCEMTVEANPRGGGSQEQWHGQGTSRKAERWGLLGAKYLVSFLPRGTDKLNKHDTDRS